MVQFAILIPFFSSFSITAFAQNSTLINPYTRFSNLSLSLPISDYPSLQSVFTTPPDCGENSYVGRGRLRGRRALITGGDSGIGRAIAIAYAREGARIAINYLPAEEEDAQSLEDVLSRDRLSVVRIPGNLLNETFCAELVGQAHERLGGLDILVNNAAYGGYQTGPNLRLIHNQTTEEWDTVFLFGSFFTTRAAVPLLPPGSSLIYTASNVARLPPQNAVPYAASKAAIVSMIRSLSNQLAPQGIRVNGVAPGLTYSPFLAAVGMTTEDVTTNIRSPMGRIEQPVELSPVYVDLAEASKTYVTGHIWGDAGGQFGF
ncbi:hypothetical protein N0V90_011312 [Kalmusia sp. IMI 367209]|nr:hypothetical protein N0V90_011312 [Kalmusia sp. IMI 367209]